MPKPSTIAEFCEQQQPGFIAAHTPSDNRCVLKQDYWLQKLDPAHRPQEYLNTQFKSWCQSPSDLDFFDWCAVTEATRDYQVNSIIYLQTDEQRQDYQAQLVNGYIGLQDAIADTTHFEIPGKGNGYAAYVITADGTLYLNDQHQKNCFSHASFTNGEPVVCAGMIKIVDGKIMDINNISGHYRPDLSNFLQAILRMPSELFHPEGRITWKQPYFAAASENMLRSEYKSLRFFGTCLAGSRRIHQFPSPDSFIDFAVRLVAHGSSYRRNEPGKDTIIQTRVAAAAA